MYKISTIVPFLIYLYNLQYREVTMTDKHIEVKDGKIVFASEELEHVLCLFYFGYMASPILLQMNKNFKLELFKFIGDLLTSIGLSWEDIPDKNSDWGDVIIKIRKMKEEGLTWNEVNSMAMGKKTFE